MRPLKDIFWSWVGGFLGIFSIAITHAHLSLSAHDNVLLIGSFGASAVLIYGAPQAEFSQPRSLVGGHLLSASTGVTMHMLFPHSVAIAGALAVATAIAIMLLTRTTHPPGGATALIAVIGGYKIHTLGFLYVLTPVLSGVIIMLVVALVVNNLSSNPTRHYPRFWF